MAPKTSKVPFYTSATILVALLIASVWLFITNESTIGKAEDLSTKIATKKWEILEVSKERNVVVTKILTANTVPPTLNLRSLIASFRDVAARTNVRFKGFNINRDVITTSLTATEGNPNIHPDPASTIVTMMRAYMTANGDGNFTLDPIRAISWDTKSRTTWITLRVVPTTKK